VPAATTSCRLPAATSGHIDHGDLAGGDRERNGPIPAPRRENALGFALAPAPFRLNCPIRTAEPRSRDPSAITFGRQTRRLARACGESADEAHALCDRLVLALLGNDRLAQAYCDQAGEHKHQA
jgi:hypothetical protein